MIRALLAAFIIATPNPMLGPDNDWAPLTRAYQTCAETSMTYFSYTVCTVGALDRALHPTFKA